MKDHFSRRAMLISAAASLSLPGLASESGDARFRARMGELEGRHGGRLGVALLDTRTGLRLEYRGRESFPLCSTFKFLASAATLERVDDKSDRFDRRIAYNESDLDTYAPATRPNVREGFMRLVDLCAAAMVVSDNTAGNLLLREMGGPPGLTRYLRELDDPVSRLDRTEPTLNTAMPGDPRDTTQPAAMLDDTCAILLGSRLSPGSREMLEGWMMESQTGVKRLRAGVPADWRVGDKTGTGENATANTIAIIYPPHRARIVAAVYYTASQASREQQNEVHAEIGRMITDLL
jgi:beta-lactamase class A